MTDLSSLADFGTRLFVQAGTNEATAVADLCGTENVGAVFTSRDTAAARGAIMTVRGTTHSAPILLDANLYSGKRRKFAGAGIDPGWLTTQRKMDLTWAMTDSGYLGDGDTAGLRTILSGARRQGDRVIATLPVASSWWAPGQRDILINEVGEHGVPVGLILEHANDPFSVVGTVQGILALLAASPVPVVLLRSDISGLGALAFGGAAASIGTRSSLRHLYPSLKKGGPSGGQISLLWPKGLAYRTVEKLQDAIAADPDSLNWICKCSACYTRSIEWILNSRDVHTNAYRHSVAATRMLADDVEAGRTQWIGMCRMAQSYSWEIAGQSGKSWEPPKFLNAWNKAVPVSVS